MPTTYPNLNLPKLNDKQLNLLKLIYKFRFVTSSLLAEHRRVTVSSMNKSLKVLMDRRLVSRRFNSFYRLRNKPASYYLAPAGLKLLRDEYDFNSEVLRARYKDPSVGEAFIDHNVEVFSIYSAIHMSRPETFQILTKYELRELKDFPELLPDLYLRRNEDLEGSMYEYFIRYYAPSTLVWVIKKDIDRYMKHYEEEGWEEEYPTIILLVKSKRTRDNLEKYIEKKMDELYIDEEDLTFMCLESMTNRASGG